MLLPVLIAMVALLLQPAILLYNHCIMNAAAAEGSRLLATNTASEANVRAYVERRLGAIPDIPAFHEGTWDITWSSESQGANVSIVNHVRPLPLFGIATALSGHIGTDGCIEQKAQADCSLLPDWVADQGYAPSTWIGEWD